MKSILLYIIIFLFIVTVTCESEHDVVNYSTGFLDLNLTLVNIPARATTFYFQVKSKNQSVNINQCKSETMSNIHCKIYIDENKCGNLYINVVTGDSELCSEILLLELYYDRTYPHRDSVQRVWEKDMKNVCNATDETVLYNNSTGTGPNILYNATDKTILHSNSIGTEFPKEVIIGVVPVLIVTIIMVVVCIFYRRKNKAVDVSYPEESLYSDPNCIQYAQLQLAEPQPNSYLSQRENVGYSEIIGVLKPQQ